MAQSRANARHCAACTFAFQLKANCQRRRPRDGRARDDTHHARARRRRMRDRAAPASPGRGGQGAEGCAPRGS